MLRYVIGLATGLLFVAAVAVAQPFNPQIQLAINQLVTGVTPFTALRHAANAYMNWGATSGVNGYGMRDNAGIIETKNAGGSWLPLPTSSTLPTAASFLTRVAEANLSNETALGTLASGLVLNATGTGIPTIYAGASCTNQFPRALNASGVATCATVSLTLDVTGTLPLANGGLGLTTGTSGGILGFTAAGTLASSGALTANALVLGGGAGATPTPLGSLGTTTTLLHGNAAGAPTFAAVTLTTDVTGILPGANGGTGNGFFAVSGPATSLKTYTLPNASTTILTTNALITAAQGGTGLSTYVIGDLLQADSTSSLARLAAASTGNALISGGVGVASSWGKIGLTTHISGTLGPTNGGTGFASYTVGDLLYANATTSLARLAAPAIGQVLISQGVSTAPAWSATARVTSITLGSANLTFSGATPTISSGFGTSPSVTAGTAAAFRVDVGTGGTANQGIVELPTAANGWNCDVENLTGTNANRADQRTVQIASTTTTVTVENQTISTGAVLAWAASDILAVTCAAF